MTAAQRLVEEGRKEGREEGREEGERRMFAEVVATRFGELSEADAQRLTEVPSDQIGVLLKRIFVAQSLDELLADDEAPST